MNNFFHSQKSDDTLECRVRHRAGVVALWNLLLWMATLFAGEASELPSPSPTKDGYAIPQPGYRFSFPRDHGSHPDFKLEWWYITGHLRSEGGRRFGFQATFFREAGPNQTSEPGPSAGFAHRPLFLGHMALLDVADGRFLHQSRLNRSGWDAGSTTNHLEVWNGNWRLTGTERQIHPHWSEASQLELHLAGTIRGDALLDLQLTPEKPLVVFGTNGVSRKANSPSAASHYLTFPRLKTKGSLVLGGESLVVEGLSWMDHEISSGQLGENQVGWDWACLQLKDGRDIMTYRLRNSDGSTDPNSSLTWVNAEGATTPVGPDQFRWQPTHSWKSPVTGASYPNRVRIETTDPASGKPISLHLEPLSERQELVDELSGVAYWEGGCRVRDAEGREIGQAFLELTGYSASLASRLK